MPAVLGPLRIERGREDDHRGVFDLVAARVHRRDRFERRGVEIRVAVGGHDALAEVMGEATRRAAGRAESEHCDGLMVSERIDEAHGRAPSEGGDAIVGHVSGAVDPRGDTDRPR